jgi:O-antigen biosynthesis protein
MEFTGERFVPGVKGQVKQEHLHRYALCRNLVRHRRVLDIASGEGYGAAMLAATATCVMGIDVNAGAVRHARDTYGRAANLHFAVGRCEAIPLVSQSIDVVVSFETIEHLEHQAELLDEIKRVLTPQGLLVISSPDRLTYSASTGLANPFHVKELSIAELDALLRARFRTVRLWGQRQAVGTFSYSLDDQGDGSETVSGLVIVDDDVRAGVARLDAPVYCIGVCSDGPLDDVRFDSVILEPDDDYYMTLAATLRGYQQVHQQQDAIITRLQAEIEASKDAHEVQSRAWAAEQAQFEAHVTALTNERERDRRHHADLIEHLRGQLSVVHASRSWRVTAPMRGARRALGGLKHSAALRLERSLRSGYRRLSIGGQHRWKIKSAVFARTGWLMRGTASYQHWLGTYRRALNDDSPILVHPMPANMAPGTETLRLPYVDNPLVSVIVPVYGHLDHTWRCLASIARHPPTTPIEVIVVDDASREDMRSALGAVEGLRVVRNDRNEGFVRSCNRGARIAQGRFLFFLNNDTEVLPGWCDELVATFDVVPQAGIVGSKLLYPDGRLQEAGGIIWRDGSGWNVGKLDDPARPEYSYRREVDYVSGAALLVPTELFWELGGFDAHYEPAYGEDSDLAFKVREAGRTVVFQPLSQIVHHEGVTSGTDLSRGVKAYQVENERKLYARWREQLATHQEPGRHVTSARERGVSRRVLVLDLCTPEPDKDAGSITAFTIMRVLQRLDCKVTFAPVDNYLFLDRYTTDLQRLGIECLYAPFVTSVDEYLRQHGELFDLVLIFRSVAASRHLAAVRRLAPMAKVVLHTSDLHFLREQREAELRNDPRMRQRADRLKQEELSIVQQVDCTIVHSTFEQELLAREVPQARVIVFGWAIDVPGTTSSFEARRDVAFIGGYQHPPNVDGALFFARGILPLVQQLLPDVRFHVVGSNPPAELLALQNESIRVTGFVPDLGPLLDRMRLSVAPLRYGAGIKGKIGTSLSHGLPCVATPLAVEGMALTPERDVLVATTPQEFASAVVRAYTDATLWNALSANGLTFVRDQYSLEGAIILFGHLLDSLRLDRAGRTADSLASRPQRDGLERAVLSASADDRAYRRGARARLIERDAIEAALIPTIERPFTIDGFCIACQRAQPFSVGFEYAVADARGRRVPNWREHLVCACGLNARTRAAIHVLTMTLRASRNARIYVMEQTSPLYEWLRARFPNVVGSEYLGEAAPLGHLLNGIRNEDATKLTFGSGRFDFVLSFDVFEHVPNYAAAFAEACRCLAPGGTLLFTAPFDRDSDVTVHRARVSSSGEIEHLLEPEFHGDPINPSGGILCFQHFGWDLVEILKTAGFSDVRGQFLWSRRLGYLGGEQVLFTAVK